MKVLSAIETWRCSEIGESGEVWVTARYVPRSVCVLRVMVEAMSMEEGDSRGCLLVIFEYLGIHCVELCLEVECGSMILYQGSCFESSG